MDIVVIGGGLTGLSSALYAAEQGLSVTLLEAGRIGSQASGRNGGQALQGLAASMSTVEKAVGLDAAKAIWSMSREALGLLKSNVQRYGIACDMAQNGYVYAATHAGQMRDLAAWQAAAASQYGYADLTLLDRTGLADHLASPRYVGGLFDPHEVHLDPLAYTLGIAAAAETAGASLHEQSPALSWRRQDGLWLVDTPEGQIRGRYLMLAVNAGASGIAPELARYFLPVESFIVATVPLAPPLAAALLPSGAAVADCKHVLNYFRLGADHRLLFGGRASGVAASRQEDTRQRMLEVFPQLVDVEISHAWGGYVDVTPHKLPHFGRLAENCYFAQGFSGHGLALTGLAGKLVVEAVLGQPARFDRFAALPQYRLPTHLPGFARSLVTLGMSWYQLRDWAEAAWHAD
ncbi:FAD-binding oxidoreductase [Chitinimonas naiadis]